MDKEASGSVKIEGQQEEEEEKKAQVGKPDRNHQLCSVSSEKRMISSHEPQRLKKHSKKLQPPKVRDPMDLEFDIS